MKMNVNMNMNMNMNVNMNMKLKLIWCFLINCITNKYFSLPCKIIVNKLNKLKLIVIIG